MEERGGPQYRRSAKAGSSSHAYGIAVPERLHDAIESERDNLSKAESLLGCLAIAMEYPSDLVDAPYYPDVAQMARELVKKSINRLDPLILQRLLRNRIKEEGGNESVIHGWHAESSALHGGYDLKDRARPMVSWSYKARALRLHRRVARNYGRALVRNAASAVSASAKICG